MDIVVVDDLPGFDNAESRFCLRRSPAPGICSPDRNGIGAVIPSEGIPLRRSNADVPVKRMIDRFLRRRPLRNRTLASVRLQLADRIRPAPGKQGQQQRQYQRQQFHQRKFTLFFASNHQQQPGKKQYDVSAEIRPPVNNKAVKPSSLR